MNLNYYELLGVLPNADTDEIKRAYAKKRREETEDKALSIEYNLAYDTLCNEEKRKSYDVKLRYGKKCREMEQKIASSANRTERILRLREAKALYQEILQMDRKNLDALEKACRLGIFFGEYDETLHLIEDLYAEASDCKEPETKVRILQFLVETYHKYNDKNRVRQCYEQIYETDVSYVDDVIALLRIYADEQKRFQFAMDMLIRCMKESQTNAIRIRYLCETLRLIRMKDPIAFVKLENSIYTELESLHSDNLDEHIANASSILLGMEDCVQRKDFECFRKLSGVYEGYQIQDEDCQQAVTILKQIAAAWHAGKVHPTVEMYLTQNHTKDSSEIFGMSLLKDFADIEESLFYLKHYAPLFWESGDLQKLEHFIERKKELWQQYRAFYREISVSEMIKKVLRLLLLEEIHSNRERKTDIEIAVEQFFKEENKTIARHSVLKMEEIYPLCYTLITTTAFKGYDWKKILGTQWKPPVIEEEQEEPQKQGFLSFLSERTERMKSWIRNKLKWKQPKSSSQPDDLNDSSAEEETQNQT